MAEPGINFSTFSAQVNAKLDIMNLTANSRAHMQNKIDCIFDLADFNQDKVLHTNELNEAWNWFNIFAGKAEKTNDANEVNQEQTQQQKTELETRYDNLMQKINNLKSQGEKLCEQYAQNKDNKSLLNQIAIYSAALEECFGQVLDIMLTKSDDELKGVNFNAPEHRFTIPNDIYKEVYKTEINMEEVNKLIEPDTKTNKGS